MQQRSSYEPASEGEQSSSKSRTSFVQRLWRNQAGIVLAVALTLAAAAILFWSRHP